MKSLQQLPPSPVRSPDAEPHDVARPSAKAPGADAPHRANEQPEDNVEETPRQQLPVSGGAKHLEPTSGLPVLPPRNALIELAVFFVVIMALQWGWQSFPDLNEIEPHPFWLPVLLLSLQYGTVSGLLAAGAAILFTAFMGWPEQDIGENHFNYLIRIWTQPVLWIGAAMLLGQFRMRQISERRELHKQVAELYKQRAAIYEYSVNLRQHCEVLERKIAGARAPTAAALLDCFAAFERHDPKVVLNQFGTCMEAALGPGQFSLFVLHNDELSLVCSSGWEKGTSWRDRFGAQYPLQQALLARSHGVTVLRESDEAILDGQGLAAVAVLSPTGERVLGMLKVELMEPARFDAETVTRLDVIAAQLAPSLELHAVDDAATAGQPKRATGRGRKSPWRHVHWQPAHRAAKSVDADVEILKKPKIVR